MIPNNFSEFDKFVKLLQIMRIPYEIDPHPMMGGRHLWIPERHSWRISVILNDYSYGRESGLLEMWIRRKRDPDGYLGAEQACKIICEEMKRKEHDKHLYGSKPG